jgi:uncharacterized repeat protein (TIGR03987 family)
MIVSALLITLALVLYSLEPHPLTGQTALWLMSGHAVWATFVVRKGSEKTRTGFHRYSLFVWLVWLVPYFGGMVLAMKR